MAPAICLLEPDLRHFSHTRRVRFRFIVRWVSTHLLNDFDGLISGQDFGPANLPRIIICTMISKKQKHHGYTMNWKSADLQTRLYIIAALILMIGLGCSFFIYFTAGEIDADMSLGNPLEESNSYRRSLELYGGKANLLASEFMDWFHRLWQGKTLGITIGCITGVICLGILLFAYNLPSDSE
jgi:hypothetical protein